MKNLGAKLKAAREAKELSLRDVADATRLRIHVLENMEKGAFDYDLPDIYKRGFLRIYAAFLKFNVDDIMREYNTAMAMRSPDDSGKRPVMVAVEEEIPQITNFEDSQDVPSDEIDMTSKYIKLGGAFVLAILAIIVVVMIASSLIKDEPSNREESQPTTAVENSINEVSVKPVKLVVTASGDTYITISKVGSKEVIFTGTLKNGMVKDFALEETLFVRVADASKIKLERDGDVIYDKSRTGVCGFNVSPR